MNDPPIKGRMTPARVKKTEGPAKRPCHICGPSSSQLLSTQLAWPWKWHSASTVSDFGLKHVETQELAEVGFYCGGWWKKIQHCLVTKRWLLQEKSVDLEPRPAPPHAMTRAVNQGTTRTRHQVIPALQLSTDVERSLSWNWMWFLQIFTFFLEFMKKHKHDRKALPWWPFRALCSALSSLATWTEPSDPLNEKGWWFARVRRWGSYWCLAGNEGMIHNHYW